MNWDDILAGLFLAVCAIAMAVVVLLGFALKFAMLAVPIIIVWLVVTRC